MAFTKTYREQMVGHVVQRFKCYWHVMHPVTFESRKLYQLAYTKDEWDALMLLTKRRQEVINDGYRWRYHDLQEDITLEFGINDELPEVDLKSDELPDVLVARLRAWAVEAKRYDELSTLLRQKVKSLVHQEYDGQTWDNKRIFKAVVNTPGTLHRVWPELLPFLDSEQRETMRGKQMKSPLPRIWGQEDYDEFHEGEQMAQLTEALIAMALLPDKYDHSYPEIA